MARWQDLPIWIKIARNIREIRMEKGLPQTEVAEKLQMKLKTYRSVEKGNTESLALKELFKIIEILDVSTEEIIPL